MTTPLGFVGRSVLSRGMPLTVAVHFPDRRDRGSLQLVLPSLGISAAPSVSSPFGDVTYFTVATNDLPIGQWPLAVSTLTGDYRLDTDFWLVSEEQYFSWYEERAEPFVRERPEAPGIHVYIAVRTRLRNRLSDVAAIFALGEVGRFGPGGEFKESARVLGNPLDNATYEISEDHATWLADVMADEILYLCAGGMIPRSLQIELQRGKLRLSMWGEMRPPRAVAETLLKYSVNHALAGPRLANVAGDLVDYQSTMTAEANRIRIMMSCGKETEGEADPAPVPASSWPEFFALDRALKLLS